MNNMKKDLATPRPWKAECLSPNNVWINSIADDRGPMPLARTLNGSNDIYDADLIVRAVNNFDALLEACKEALHGLQLESESNDGIEIRNRRRIEIAKQAIANAEK